MAKFEERDALFPGKLSINAEEVLALDGAKCTPKTRDGILSLGGASCYDIGYTLQCKGRYDIVSFYKEMPANSNLRCAPYTPGAEDPTPPAPVADLGGGEKKDIITSS